MTKILGLFVGLVLCSSVFAAGSGHSLGFGVVLTTPGQEDLNTVIDEINASESRAINKLGTAYELTSYYQYRFSSSMFALQFRPSYFTQSATGSSYDTKLTGFTFFPMVRMYPLENNFIHFFMQTGVGYGRMTGTMSGPNGSVDWVGGAFGAMAGMGAEFCFTDAHCVIVEGNVRYLPIERNIVSGTSGTPSGFDTITNDGELENGNMDVKSSMSGIQGALHYQLNF
ncbi:MAG: hypothetical protein ACXWC9_07370 [Pseudobdellovibrionaceae bacterium]